MGSIFPGSQNLKDSQHCSLPSHWESRLNPLPCSQIEGFLIGRIYLQMICNY